MAVVSDASPLIALAAAGQLHLLRELFGEVHVPHAVWHEVVQGDLPGAVQLASVDWLCAESAPEDSQLLVLQRELDEGEAQAIALAVHLAADLVLVDERVARTLARDLGFEVTGAVGVLLRAKARGLIPLVRPVVDRMRTEVGFRVSQRFYESTLRSCGEWEGADRPVARTGWRSLSFRSPP